jgi:hypothetical protein
MSDNFDQIIREVLSKNAPQTNPTVYNDSAGNAPSMWTAEGLRPSTNIEDRRGDPDLFGHSFGDLILSILGKPSRMDRARRSPLDKFDWSKPGDGMNDR